MIPMPELKTDRLGGGDIPSAKELLAMGEDSGAPCLLSYSVSVALLKRGRNFVEVAARHGAIPEPVVTVEAVRLRLEYA